MSQPFRRSTVSDFDDELEFVVSTTSGSGRISTPSKSPAHVLLSSNRASSATRTSSATKDRTLFQALQDTETVKRVAPRTTSRRKARQLENNTMAALHRAMLERGINIEDDDDEDERNPNSRAKFGIRVTIKSMFSELFEDKNSAMREEFRTCAMSTTVTALSSSSRSRSHIPIRNDQWGEAEKAWLQMETRLRNVVVRSLSNEELCYFVRAMELVLLYFIAQNDVPPHVPVALSSRLELPLEVCSASLTVTLKDSSFHRLLLHAACQFYGLKSKVRTSTALPYSLSSSVPTFTPTFLNPPTPPPRSYHSDCAVDTTSVEHQRQGRHPQNCHHPSHFPETTSGRARRRPVTRGLRDCHQVAFQGQQ